MSKAKKILFVWPGLTGYMGDCWRTLATRPSVELRIAIDASDNHYGAAFSASDVLRGLDWSDALPHDGWSPDVVFSVGWSNRLCRSAALSFPGAAKICCFDMPWQWRIRKFAARFVLWRYLRRYDAAFIPGAAAMPYARWLGFGRGRLFTGLFATDTSRFGVHIGGGGFLYVGRDCLEKGTDVLRAAHALYLQQGGTWPLEVASGISPSKLGPIYAKADCFVLPSRFEPWGVALAEAAAAGLPIICTRACGAHHELLASNGLVIKPGSVQELANAMEAVSSGRVHLDGESGRILAKPFSCGAWADRVLSICRELTGGGNV